LVYLRAVALAVWPVFALRVGDMRVHNLNYKIELVIAEAVRDMQGSA
jgi:hypothetical protein